MRFVLDADVLIYALHVPRDKRLLREHRKASLLFESFIEGRNELYVPTSVAAEVATVLSRILGKDTGREGFERLASAAEEVYPVSGDLKENVLFAATSNLYFDRCIENAGGLSKITKDAKDKGVPGWKGAKTEVLLSGMDLFVLSYAQLKNAYLLTNDWSLWYTAWKSGLKSYWLKGLEHNDTEQLSAGRKIEYPKP